MKIYAHPEARHKESAADEAGNPYATEHNKIASHSKNASITRSVPPLPSSFWLSSFAIYNTKSTPPCRIVKMESGQGNRVI